MESYIRSGKIAQTWKCPKILRSESLRLAARIAVREFKSRFVGTLLGRWHFLVTPVVILTVYSFIFGRVFGIKFPSEQGGGAPFGLVMFVSFIVFNFCSEVLIRSPGLVLDNPQYVKKVIFPLEILVPSTLMISGLNLASWCIIAALGYGLAVGIPPPSVLSIPLIILALAPLVAGIGWFVAGISVYLRDVRIFMTLIVNELLFMTPIFYPLSAVPEPYRTVMGLNPIAQGVEMMRAAVFAGIWPNKLVLTIVFAVSSLASYLGYRFFQAVRRGFADVI